MMMPDYGSGIHVRPIAHCMSVAGDNDVVVV